MKLTAALLVCIGCLVGCKSSEALDLPTADCSADAGAVPTYSAVTAFTTCTACHSSKLTGSARNDAPSDINFDTYDAAKTSAQDAASEVNMGTMPPSDSKLTISTDEKDSLYRWALCGTPNG
jgi:uncharacterized membrane protein